MRTAQDAFKAFVATDVSPLLKDRGFCKKAFTFERKLDGIVHIVQFQKSVYTSSTEIPFTVNVGVFSARLAELMREFDWHPSQIPMPGHPECRLAERIGFLGPKKRDTWWRVRATGISSAAAGEIRRLLSERAVPFLDAIQGDTDLRDYWLRRSKRRKDVPDVVELALLLHDLGPRAELLRLVTLLRGQTSRHAASLASIVAKIAAARTSRGAAWP